VSLPEDDVRHVARLARLFVTDEEVAQLAPQLNAILDYAEQIAAIAADDVEPMTHPFAPADVTRPDIPEASLERDAVLAVAPDVQQNRFAVPRIVAEEG
jgi:aspartyl-tRNA(Asn)/glutamyl-tRNA(Gln) amidotransferase subunit C